MTKAQYAKQACQILLQAYARGARNGGSIDWGDIDEAYQCAKLSRPTQRKRKKG